MSKVKSRFREELAKGDKVAVLDSPGAGGKCGDLRNKETCKYPLLGSVCFAVCVCVC